MPKSFLVRRQSNGSNEDLQSQEINNQFDSVCKTQVDLHDIDDKSNTSYSYKKFNNILPKFKWSIFCEAKEQVLASQLRLQDCHNNNERKKINKDREKFHMESNNRPDSCKEITEDSYNKTKLECDECGKSFKTRYTLRIHRKMPSHTSVKPFVCPTCGKGFRLSSTLCRHKIIHTSQRPHECQQCGKSFNRSSTLKTHMRTHNSKKEFQCNLCGKGFHQKGNLRNHVLIHTGEKPYQCEVCSREFNKLSNLKFHMHSHTDHKPYRCRHCKSSFSRRAELKQHIEHIHPNE